MKRNKKGSMPEINRAMYKSVKKFDHNQLVAFCTDIYGFGFEDGKDSVQGIDLDAVFSLLEGIKGIGPKKMEEIKDVLNGAFSSSEAK